MNKFKVTLIAAISEDYGTDLDANDILDLADGYHDDA